MVSLNPTLLDLYLIKFSRNYQKSHRFPINLSEKVENKHEKNLFLRTQHTNRSQILLIVFALKEDKSTQLVVDLKVPKKSICRNKDQIPIIDGLINYNFQNLNILSLETEIFVQHCN